MECKKKIKIMKDERKCHSLKGKVYTKTEVIAKRVCVE
jgi:hypothetical protein